MRRTSQLPALFTLLVLLAATPAPASVLVVEETVNTGNGVTAGTRLTNEAVYGAMAIRNARFDWQPSTSVTTAGVRAGQFTANGETRTHHAVVRVNASMANLPRYSSTYDPRLLFDTANWPSVPHLVIFEPFNCSYTDQAESTGVSNATCTPTNFRGGSFYTTNGPWVWKDLLATPKAVRLTGAAGILRPVIGYRTTPAAFSAQVKDADSLDRKGGLEDSVVVWIRARGAGDPAAQVLIFPGFNQATATIGLIEVGLALLDSITSITYPGGKVFEDRAATTVYHSAVINSANLLSAPAGSGVTNGGGAYCPSGNEFVDTCDVANRRKGQDSTQTLGIPITALLEPESLAVGSMNRTLADIWKEDPNVRFGLQSVSGAFGVLSRTRAAGVDRCIDGAGVFRRRKLFGAIPSLNPSCTADTGSIACNVKNGFAALEAYAPGRIEPVFLPHNFDWTPQEWTSNAAGERRAGGEFWGGFDSLAAAYYAGGARELLISPTYLNANVGQRMSFNIGSTGSAEAPAGWSPQQTVFPVRWGGVIAGHVRTVAARYEPSPPWWTWRSTGHDLSAEYWHGRTVRNYYPQSLNPYWSHTFQIPTDVFMLPSDSFGGPWGNPWPQFPGYRHLKWLVHAHRAADSFLPKWADGTPKSLNQWVYVSQLPVPRSRP